MRFCSRINVVRSGTRLCLALQIKPTTAGTLDANQVLISSVNPCLLIQHAIHLSRSTFPSMTKPWHVAVTFEVLRHFCPPFLSRCSLNSFTFRVALRPTIPPVPGYHSISILMNALRWIHPISLLKKQNTFTIHSSHALNFTSALVS